MRASVVRIGNSRGIRIPKALLEHYRLTDAVELEMEDDHLVIRRPFSKPRQGWEDAFRVMHQHGADKLLDQKTPTAWDRTEWQW
jgi:antitoxin MazE